MSFLNIGRKVNFVFFLPLFIFFSSFLPTLAQGIVSLPPKTLVSQTATTPASSTTAILESLGLSYEELKKLPKERQIQLLKDFRNKTFNQQASGGCFDYYHFQSVVFSLKTDKASYQPGETVHFKGTIENNNTYPVFDGLIFVRIAREGTQPTVLGNDIVDERVLVQKIVLPAGGKVNQSLSYTLPANLTGGKYSASFFFSVGGSFNLAGLPFTNEVVGTNIGFTVDGPQGVAIHFDRAATKIDERIYKHIGNWPVVDEGKEVVVSNTLVNESNLSQIVTVQYDWYRWDGLRESDRLAQSTDTFILKPKEKKVISYQTPSLTEPVYYLRTTAISGVTKSIINVRLATNASRLRIGYAGVDVFPVNKNQEGTVFVCFHNTSSTSTQGFINVKAYSDEKLVAEVATSTTVSGAIGVITKKIIGPFSNLAIKAEVSDAKGNIVDKYEYKYQCQDIPGNVSCLPGPELQKKSSYFIASVVSLITVLLGVTISGLVIRRKRKKNV